MWFTATIERFEVVAFTAAQIPAIAGRRYPPVLAGARYPDGIPIVAEDALRDGMPLYAQYPHLGPVLPAMGYSPAQLAALAQSIAAAPVDVVVSGTPIDLAALVSVAKPVIRAHYEFAETGSAGLGAEIDRFLESVGLAASPGS